VFFAPPLALREGDRKKLGDLARLPSVPSGLAKRPDDPAGRRRGAAEIARVTGASRPTVIAWRERYDSGGMAAPPRCSCPRAWRILSATPGLSHRGTSSFCLRAFWNDDAVAGDRARRTPLPLSADPQPVERDRADPVRQRLG
jgi:hypothetical protein